MTTVRKSPNLLLELADRIEIQELCARYTQTGNADPRDAQGHAATFTPDGVLETLDEDGRQIEGWVFRGREAIAALAANSPFGPIELTSDSIVELSGDTATQVSTFVFGMRRRDRAGFRIVTSGHYNDQLVRTDEGWRFARRTVFLHIGIEEFVAAMMSGGEPE